MAASANDLYPVYSLALPRGTKKWPRRWPVQMIYILSTPVPIHEQEMAPKMAASANNYILSAPSPIQRNKEMTPKMAASTNDAYTSTLWPILQEQKRNAPKMAADANHIYPVYSLTFTRGIKKWPQRWQLVQTLIKCPVCSPEYPRGTKIGLKDGSWSQQYIFCLRPGLF